MIRRVKDEDAKRLVEIYNYYIRETEITLELSELTEGEYLDRIHQVTAFYPWLVYEEDGKILGFAYLDKFNTRKAYLSTADLSIYVDSNVELKKDVNELLNKYCTVGERCAATVSSIPSKNSGMDLK